MPYFLPFILTALLSQPIPNAPESLKSITKKDIDRFREGRSICYSVRRSRPPYQPVTDVYCDDAGNGPGLDIVKTRVYKPSGEAENAAIHIISGSERKDIPHEGRAIHLKRHTAPANDFERNFFFIRYVYSAPSK